MSYETILYETGAYCVHYAKPAARAQRYSDTMAMNCCRRTAL